LQLSFEEETRNRLNVSGLRAAVGLGPSGVEPVGASDSKSIN